MIANEKNEKTIDYFSLIKKGVIPIFFMLLSFLFYDFYHSILETKLITDPKCHTNSICGCFVDTLIDILSKICKILSNNCKEASVITAYYIILYAVLYFFHKHKMSNKINDCIVILLSISIPTIFTLLSFMKNEKIEKIARIAGDNERLFVFLTLSLIIYSLYISYSKLMCFYKELKKIKQVK